jgi:adenylate kinase family enzyme
MRGLRGWRSTSCRRRERFRLATLVAQSWQLPRAELDALHHGPNWQPRPTFVAEVEAFVQQPRWVTEWQYTARLGDILHSRADCVLWLDHPRSLVMRQVIGRTLARRLQRRQLGNGNVEPPLWTVFTDPEHVVRWAWRTQGPRDSGSRRCWNNEVTTWSLSGSEAAAR